MRSATIPRPLSAPRVPTVAHAAVKKQDIGVVASVAAAVAAITLLLVTWRRHVQKSEMRERQCEMVAQTQQSLAQITQQLRNLELVACGVHNLPTTYPQLASAMQCPMPPIAAAPAAVPQVPPPNSSLGTAMPAQMAQGGSAVRMPPVRTLPIPYASAQGYGQQQSFFTGQQQSGAFPVPAMRGAQRGVAL